MLLGTLELMETGSFRQPLSYVYVAGSGHSGSTLISFLLNSAPDVFAIGEAHASRARLDPRTRSCSCGRVLLECPFFLEQKSRFAEYAIHFDPSAWALDYTIEGSPLLGRIVLGSLRHSRLERVRDSLLRPMPPYRQLVRAIDFRNCLFVHNVLEITGRHVFVDATKDPFRVFHLQRVFGPRLKVLHLVRDPRATVYSYYALLLRRRPDLSRKQRLRAANRFASQWCRTQSNVERSRAVVNDENRMLVRYEDLCANPATELDRIGKLIGVGAIPVPEDYRAAEHHIMGNIMRENTGSTRISADDRWLGSIGR